MGMQIFQPKGRVFAQLMSLMAGQFDNLRQYWTHCVSHRLAKTRR
jgi:hypothetical protein